MMRTIFINHSERLSVTKIVQSPYQESNRRGPKNGRESAMLTTFITCHSCKKTDLKVRNCKRKFERECEMEKSGKFNHEKEKKWCRYHKTNGHSDKQYFQQMEKSEKKKKKKAEKMV